MEKKKIIKLNLKKLYGGATNLENVLIREKGDNHNNKMIGEITKLIEAVKNNDTTLSNMNFPISMPSQEYMQRTPTNITDQAEGSIAEERLNNLQLSEQNTKLMNENKELIQTLENLKKNPELVKSEDLKELEDINSKLTQNISVLQSEKEQLISEQSKIEKELSTAKQSAEQPAEQPVEQPATIKNNKKELEIFSSQVKEFEEISKKKDAVMILWVSEAFSCNELIKLLDKENPNIKIKSQNSYLPPSLSSDIIGTCVPDSNVTNKGEEDCNGKGKLIKDFIDKHSEYFNITENTSGENSDDESMRSEDENKKTNVHIFTGGLRRSVQTASYLSENIKNNNISVEINISKFLSEGRMRTKLFRSYGHTPPHQSILHHTKNKKNSAGDTEIESAKQVINTPIWEYLYYDKDNSVSWDKYNMLINKSDENTWLGYFFGGNTKDYKDIIKYDHDFIKYYIFRFYTPFMPNIITKKNFFMNHVPEMFYSKYISIKEKPKQPTDEQVVEGEVEEVVKNKNDIPAEIPIFEGKIKTKYISKYPRIVKLSDYSDDPYFMYENFKQKGGMFGCYSYDLKPTEIEKKLKAIGEKLIDNEGFDKVRLDDSDKKYLKKILTCIKKHPLIIGFIKTSLKKLKTDTKFKPQEEKIDTCIKILDVNFNYENIIKELKDQNDDFSKKLYFITKFIGEEGLNKEDFQKIDMTPPEDTPTNFEDLKKIGSLPPIFIDFAEIMSTVLVVDKKKSFMPFSAPELSESFKKMFLVRTNPFEKFKGKIVIIIGHKGLMEYSTKSESTINNLTIVSQIVTNEKYYLKYEKGVVIDSGFDNSIYEGHHKSLTKEDKSEELNRCLDIIKDEGNRKVCRNIIYMEVKEGEQLGEPSDTNSQYKLEFFQYMFDKEKNIKNIFSDNKYNFVFNGDTITDKYNSDADEDNQISPDYNIYYIEGDVTIEKKPEAKPYYLKVFQEDSINAYLYLSTDSEHIFSGNLNGPFKDRNKNNIDNKQKVSIIDFRNNNRNTYFENTINYNNNDEIIITLKDMNDLISDKEITIESEEKDINPSGNFSEPLSIVDEWISVTKSNKDNQEITTSLEEFLGNNFDGFQKIINKELKKEHDIIQLYKTKLNI